VIEAFQVVGCSYEDADSLANEVDRKGRAMVFLGFFFIINFFYFIISTLFFSVF
jgi:hypothetical protein